MRQIILMIIILMLLASGLVADEIQKKHDQMLYPVCRVTVGSSGGSGTVLYSEDRGDGRQTYVLTNHHVVADAIAVERKWSSLLQKDVKREVHRPVRVEIFRYSDGSRQDVCDSYRAEVVAHDKDHDLALLKLKTGRKIAYVAVLLPAGETVAIFEQIWAIGCSLLHPPVVTEGVIDYLDDVIDRKVYWMGSANIIYGNSGGAVFIERGGRYCFIGVPSRLSVTGFQAITHMGYFVPITRIRKWIKAEHLTFLTDEEVKPTECFAKREEMKKKADLHALLEDEK